MRRVGKRCSGVETPLFERMIVAQQVGEGAAEVNVEDVPAAGVTDESDASVNYDNVTAAVDEPSIPSPTPSTQPPPTSHDIPSTSQVKPTLPPSLIAQPQSPQQQLQPSQDADISMDLLHNLLDIYTTLTRRVKNLEQDKIVQALEITKLKQRVKTLERINKLKDVTLKDVAAVAKDVQDAEIKESSDVHGRHAESQAQIYQIDLEHADKVLSMQDIDIEPIELQEAVELVTTTKLITEVVTTASATITARKRVVIRDPEEYATPSIIIHAKAKSKDKGKGILVEEPKPLKKQAQIEQDEAYARELEAELNKNIDWDEVIGHVQRKEKKANDVKRYQALKRKPQTKAQTRKNTMIYLRNMAGFKMNYFKGMTYDDIQEDSRALKRLSETQEGKADEKQKLDEEVEELRKHLLIVPNDDDDVYTEATHLALKVIEDLEVLWQLIKERFASSKPKNFSDDFLLTTLGAMFEKPDIQAQIWKNQRSVHGLAKVKRWKLLESCGVQIIAFTTTQLILPEERKYPLTRSSRKTYQVFKTAGEKINAAKLN
nr:hypothetical protein [Tanacetum cinerariifolium]